MTREELGILLLSDCDRLGEQVVIAVGKGRILGPPAVKDAHMQPCNAAGYGILHTDEVDPGEAVTVTQERPSRCWSSLRGLSRPSRAQRA